MTAQDRNAFPFGVNMYVPAMQYASNMALGQPNAFSLGSPAAVSANLVAAAVPANAVATTLVAVSPVVVLDAKYGRTLRLTPSGNPGNSAAIDVFGRDYMGQPMVERFTGASGSTAILYGRKAFKWVTHTVIVTAASNAVTWAVGTGWRFGLPYKGDLAWAKENGILVPFFKRDFWMGRSLAEATMVAALSAYVTSPTPGFVKTLRSTSDGGGGGTDPVITVELGDVAIIGLTTTTDTSVSAHQVSDTPTTPGYSANNRFRANDLIEIVHAAAAGAFGSTHELEISPTQFSLPDLTDPGTTTTGDPRGTYESITTPAGFEIIVGLVGDNAINAANNGGLLGIKHVVA
jgi:hypothetical protein